MLPRRHGHLVEKQGGGVVVFASELKVDSDLPHCKRGFDPDEVNNQNILVRTSSSSAAQAGCECSTHRPQ
eukprot:11209850-Lingulodinium_polyedra.AAC.1